MKKILYILTLLVSITVFANKPRAKLDLSNGDVRSVLIQAASSEGYKLISAYKKFDGYGDNEILYTWVLVFKKGKSFKKYTSSSIELQIK